MRGKKYLDDEKKKIFSISSIYNGKVKLIRLISSIIEGFFLMRKAISLKPNIIISMTDPPLLNFFTSYFCKKNKIPWIYWTMDLYPDAFISAGLVSKKNLIVNFINSFLIKNPPKLIISLGFKQYEYLEIFFKNKIKNVVLPCGISNYSNSESKYYDYKNKISFCYAGNLGEAHNKEFLIEIIKNINPDKHILFLALYGSKSKSIIDFAKNKDGIIIIDRINKEYFHLIDVHLVSLNEKWDHVCVPSKAVSAISQGSAVVFDSSKNNDNWDLLKKAAWRFKYNESDKINLFFKNITKEKIINKRKESIKIKNKLIEIKKKSFNEIYKFIFK